MEEYKILIDLGYYGYEIQYGDPLYAGGYFRSLSEKYDHQETFDSGIFSFNWMWKVCVF